MINHMFFVPLVHLKVQNWNQKKIQLMSLYSDVCCNMKIVDEIYTNFHQDSFEIVNGIKNIFYDELEEFKSTFSLEEYLISNAWFELAKKNSFHSLHNHGALGYSSVCFINFNKEYHTPTKFISPFLNFLTGNVMFSCPEDVDEGSIIFFPAAIQHFTEPNTSDEERLIISFNLSVK